MDSPLPTQIWARSLGAAAGEVGGSEVPHSVSATPNPTPTLDPPTPHRPLFPRPLRLDQELMRERAAASQVHPGSLTSPERLARSRHSPIPMAGRWVDGGLGLTRHPVPGAEELFDKHSLH